MAVGDGWDIPEGVTPWSDFHWWKVAGNRVLELVVLCERPLWYVGHYHRGRMVPCLGDDCRLCRDGVGAQVRYVISAAEVSTRRVGLLEVGRGVGLQLRDWAAACGRLRGLWLELTKQTSAKQSRMEVSLVQKDPGDWYLGLGIPDIQKALYATWGKAGMEIPQQYVRADKGSPSFKAPKAVR